MSSTDWRSPAGYESLRSLDAPGMAWEFLRRNPKFAAEQAQLEQASRRGAFDPVQAEDFARRWGVRFHRREGEDPCARTAVERAIDAYCHFLDRAARASLELSLPALC